jgi:hypothetical protein
MASILGSVTILSFGSFPIFRGSNYSENAQLCAFSLSLLVASLSHFSSRIGASVAAEAAAAAARL